MLWFGIMNTNESEITSEMLFGAVPGTRSRLIEAAGVVFSEKGFDRATSREICELARVNSAAVNYHFGGKARLYVEMLREAHRRLINISALESAARDSAGDVEKRLEKVVGEILHTLLDASTEGWPAKVFLREIAAPTSAAKEVVDIQIRPTAQLVCSVIGQLMKLPADHPAVQRGAATVMGQMVFIFLNRKIVEMVFPALDLSEKGIDALALHIGRVTTAGLGALAEKIHREEGQDE